MMNDEFRVKCNIDDMIRFYLTKYAKAQLPQHRIPCPPHETAGNVQVESISRRLLNTGYEMHKR
jgi:hypothetical protein